MNRFATLLSAVLLTGSQLFASSSNKDSATFYMGLAQEAESSRRYSVAWQHYERAAGFDETNPQVYAAIADVCTRMNKMAPAIKATERMAELQPNDLQVKARLFDLYFGFGQWDKVIDFGQRLTASKVLPAGGSFKLGKAYYHKQNYGKSLPFLKAAIKEDDANAEANYLTGRMLLNMENYKQAVPYYERYLELEQTKTARIYEFAMLLTTNHEDAKAIPYYELALAKGYPANDDFYTNMAYAYADANMVEKGVELFQDLISRRPQDLGLKDALANVYYTAGKTSKAIAVWDDILKQEPNNARALYHIGLAYIKGGKEGEGKQLCDRAIEMDPSLGILRQKKMM